jgi:glycosyltransferase involved in cell wall biosynthesis
MKVSVLVPVYNGEPFLAECLESVLAQDFADMEILVADDASTDGSVALVERYAAKDSRVRWWRNPGKLGLARNFNCCLRAATGEYIKYVLQDDKLVSPLAIRSMVGLLDNYPEVALVGSASQVIDAQSRLLETRNGFCRSGVGEGKRAIAQCLEQNQNLIGEPTVTMFRKEQAARGFDERYRQVPDLEMWFYLLEQGQFAWLAEPLCAFRRHPRQQTEVNRRNHVGGEEQWILMRTCFAKPWVRKMISHRALFRQIYHLRKQRDEQAGLLAAEMMAALKPRRFAFYWLERRITRPFENLKNWLAKNFRRRACRDRLPHQNHPVA